MQISDVATQLSGNPAAAIPLLFGAGVLTSLTPCVYPMIPITAAIVGGQSASEQSGATIASKWRPLGLSLTYVLGLATVYAGLGLLAGLTGTMFGTVSSNPWAFFAMANLLLLAALSMFDVIPVRVPAAILQRAANAGTGGRVAGAFIMGAASGLVAAPCPRLRVGAEDRVGRGGGPLGRLDARPPPRSSTTTCAPACARRTT